MSLIIEGNKGYGFKINDKKYFQARYPEYEELEYINFNKQYVDTGIKINNDHIFEIKYKKDNSVSTNVYGYYAGSSGTDNFSLYIASSGASTLRYDSVSKSITGSKISDTNIHTINVSAEGYTLDKGSLVSIDDETEFTTSGNIYIGGANPGVTTSYNVFKGKIYYCKIWKNNTLVADLIPVKKESDNQKYFYDKVTKTYLSLKNF